ncbi:T6SS immunity protein Tdi1 domain-containing protein [Hymenobacter terrenus]|uniref:T6SS immunity protein Tdi1 domain-containing protein n=1 Tax=Hymenobacter terrenus TaxID=1629124 RepID=UPI0006981499|nr:T6SS immunity protein Tdi1 domain-containing protein [Hymenobacter terrenus]
MLIKLLTRFPEYTIVDQPTPELLARYRDLVPAELLEVWEQYGFGTFCDGYLKVVNPDDYADLLADTYQLTSTPAPAPPVVLFATGMGDLIIWERGFLVFVNYRHGITSAVGQNFNIFFRNLSDEDFLSEDLYWEPYPAARERLGEPAFDECFGYVPLLALGGPETVEHLEKVKLREHIFLISQFTGILER